jgi:low temperature requirement protein LtrA
MQTPISDRLRMPPGLLRPMRLRPVEEQDGDRHATWFELFFDLVFVVAVAALAEGLAEEPTRHGFVRFMLLFVPVWWTWIVYAFFSDRFDTDDVACRLLGMAGMLAIVALGVSIHHAMTDGAAAHDAAFAVSYLAARWICTALYLRAGHSLEIGRRLARIHMAMSVLATCVWMGALLLPDPWRYVVWAGTLAFEVSAPIIARRTLEAVPVTRDHIPERFGLFTLIVLGEAVAAVATGLGDAEWGVRAAIVAVLAFVLACCLWWLHFDFATTEPLTRSYAARQIYVFGHFPSVVGLTAIAAGALLAVEHAADDHLDAGARWALGGGLAVYLVAALAVRYVAMPPPRDRPLVRFRMPLSIVAVGFAVAVFGGPLPPVVAVAAVVGSMAWMIVRKVLIHAALQQGYAGEPQAIATDERRAEPARVLS